MLIGTILLHAAETINIIYKTMNKLFFTPVLLFFAVSSWAHDAEIDGIFYYLNSATKKAIVTYKGIFPDTYSNEYSGSVTIPSTFTYKDEQYSVTSIGMNAFFHCSDLTSVTIPNSVLSIGNRAFAGCSSLAEIYSLNSTPPACFDNPFDNVIKLTAKLYVPAESVNAYKVAWNGFLDILPIGTTGIETQNVSSSSFTNLYDLSGKQIELPRPGQIVIKRQGNKTVKYKF